MTIHIYIYIEWEKTLYHGGKKEEILRRNLENLGENNRGEIEGENIGENIGENEGENKGEK